MKTFNARFGAWALLLSLLGSPFAPVLPAQTNALIPLGEAVDAPSLVWLGSGNLPWNGQDIVTHDGIDAAHSGSIAHTESSSLQTTITGPGTLIFWWKVSSETNNDSLLFFINGTAQAAISGEVGWQQRTVTLPAGSQTLAWRYSKNASVAVGQDRAWVDQVQFAGTTCTYAISPTEGTHPSTTATGLVSVTTSAGCAWNVINTNTWLSILSGSNGTNNGLVRYRLVANPTTSTRVGYLLIADQWYAVTQSGATSAPCTFLLSSDHAHYLSGAPGSTGSVSVTAAPGCAWTAYTSNSWLTVLSSPSNSGNGTVVYFAPANTNGSARLGIIWIAGQPFSVGQDGFPCDYTLSSTNRTYSSEAATDTVAVATTCPWTVYTSNTWISIFPANLTSGSGNGTVTYSVAANPSPASRSGVILIGSSRLTIAQSGIDCGFSLSATNRSYGLGATNEILSFTALVNCPWTASTSNSWITILSVPTGIGGGSVFYGVAANPSPQPRTGSIMIAGQTLAITQAGIDPAIVSQPQSRSVAPGSTAIFSVGVTGTPPFTYQWQFNDAPLVDDVGVSGSSTSNLTLTGVQESQSGSYRVIVSNSAGVVSSSVATLTVSCGFSLFPNSASHSSIPATDFINVSAVTNCSWNVVNTNEWVAILSSGTNSGNATVIYSVTANPTANPRTGTIQVANLNFKITQAGDAPTNATISLVEALDTAGVLPWGTTGTPVWFGQSSVSHDGVDAAQSGPVGDSGAVTVQTTVSGPGTISFWWKVSSMTNNNYLKFFINGIQQVRISGEVDWQLRSLPIVAQTNILKWTYSKNGNGSAGLDKGWLDQVRFLPGPGCAVTLSPLSAAHSFNAETGNVRVAAEGCAWAVDNTNSWIIPGVQVGEGNADFRYTVAANDTPLSRTGVITIAGRPFTVVQALNPAFCFGAISPAYRAEYSGPGYGTVALSMPVGCPWSVVNTNPWVSITSTVNYPGGGGMVTYHIDANTNAQARSGYILIAGISFHLTQAGGGLLGTNVPPLPQFADFDVGRDFSTANNPNGVWTFGWAGTVTDLVHPLTVRRDSPADNGAYTPSWQLTYDTAPVVYCNISDQVITVGDGQAALAPREVLFDGGQDGSPENFVVIRFTAPSNGVYSVVAAVRPFYNGSPQGDADFHVVRNSTELFVEWLNPYQSAYYSNTLSMGAGETIKFLLGRGTDGHEYGSIFRIAALINPRHNATASPLITTFTDPTLDSFEDFGYSVAALGNDRVLIGAPRYDHSGSGGAAFLFGTNGALLTTFTNPTPAGLEHFGFAVATVGDRILVSSIYDSTGAAYAGVVHVFSTNGTLLTTITNPTPAYDERFGWTMAAMGSDRVLIGTEDSGSAYLFNINGTLLTTFNSPNLSPNNAFGSSLAAVGNDRVLIGVAEDYTGGPYSGIAYLFNTNGVLLTTINNPSPAAMAGFGRSAAGLGNDRLLIGADGVKVGASQSAGAAYLFGTDGTLITTFTNPTPALTNFTPGHREDFGTSVAAVGNDRVLIGAPAVDGSSTNAGTAYLFSTNGTLLATFSNPTPTLHDFFGFALTAVGSDHALIGAFNSPRSGAPVGAAFLFSLSPAGGPNNPPVGCTYAISPFNRVHDFASATGVVSVTTPAGCSWTVFNSNAWISIVSSPSNSGSGQVIYSVSANPASVARSGNISIGGQLFAISQAAAPDPGFITLPEALDTVGTPLVWTSGDLSGNWQWFGQNSVTHDGVDAARSAPITQTGASSILKTTVVGPGTLTFWWKTSAKPPYDGLHFFIDGNQQAFIGGELDWQQRTFALSLGAHQLQWMYWHDGGSSGSPGQDCGWVDQVQFVPGSNSICTIALSPGSASHGAGSSTGLVNVVTASNCSWTVVNTNPWISIVAGTNGTGNGTIKYIVATNAANSTRSGNIRIGGQNFLVTQAGAFVGCVLSLSPASRTHGSGSETGIVDVAATPGCAWTMVNTNPWISILVGTNVHETGIAGMGTGIVVYALSPNNTGSSRNGNIRIGLQNYLVTQLSGSVPCTYSISPGNRSHGSGNATGTVSVTTQIGCMWNVSETNTWISILSSLNNSNSGTVIYQLAPNTNALTRSGVIRIDGHNFIVTQSGTSLLSTNAPRIYFVGLTTNTSSLAVQGEAGRMYVVECSEDFINWRPISTNCAPDTFIDPAIGTVPKRFYRTVEIR